jgi:hypothetical protein
MRRNQQVLPSLRLILTLEVSLTPFSLVAKAFDCLRAGFRGNAATCDVLFQRQEQLHDGFMRRHIRYE